MLVRNFDHHFCASANCPLVNSVCILDHDVRTLGTNTLNRGLLPATKSVVGRAPEHDNAFAKRQLRVGNHPILAGNNEQRATPKRLTEPVDRS